MACTSALAIAANATAADPPATKPNAAGQNRTEPKPAAQRESQQNPNRDQTSTRERTAREDQATEAVQAGSLDSQLAACLIIGNHKEIAISRLAEQSQNAEVQKFAQQMIQDHEKFVAELQKFAEQGGIQTQQLAVDATADANGQPATTRESTRPQPNQPRSTAKQDPKDPSSDATRRTARSEVLDQHGNANDMLGIEREVAQQCLQSAQREMSEKQGVEADQCYVGMQVGAHMYMVDKLEVFSRHASPELQAVLQQGLQTAQQHLDHAKKLHKELDGQAKTGEQPAREKQS